MRISYASKAALTGLLANPDVVAEHRERDNDYAEHFWNIADAMIDEMKRRDNK